MKFVNAIYAGENTVMKLWTALTWLSVFTIILFSTTIYLVFRDPLIIERSCQSHLLSTASVSVTEKETENFIREALSARFDTEREKPSLLTQAQVEVREKELKELSTRKIQQTVFVDQIDLKKNGEFKAKLTRLLKVSGISTAMSFEIEAKIFETRRSEDNPYGLILSEVKLIESENRK